MSNEFTCITLSRKQLDRQMPENTSYYNRVKVFVKPNCQHVERIESIKQVNTPYFFFCDSDDPLPEVLIKPDKAIVYGDDWVTIDNVDYRKTNTHWKDCDHYNNPTLIHKAICDTKLSKQIIKHLPLGNYLTETLLYFCLADIGGFTYDSNLIMKWNKQVTGEHCKNKHFLFNSINWLKANRQRLKLFKYD